MAADDYHSEDDEIDSNKSNPLTGFVVAKANIRKWKENQVFPLLFNPKNDEISQNCQECCHFCPNTLQLKLIKDQFGDNQWKKQQESTRILNEEIKLLNEIDRKRNEAMKSTMDEQNEKQIMKLGKPIRWTGYKSNYEIEAITIHIVPNQFYWLANVLYFFADIKCEMDSLECQRIRKLTALYHRLKSPVPSIERIEYITELADVLRTEPHSPILTEVTNHSPQIRSRMFANTLLSVFFC